MENYQHCWCTANKYLPENYKNPGKKNYLFNYVTTQPTSQALSLKKGADEFEEPVLSKTTKGTYPTLTDTYEIITFEKARLKEGIEEINNRLNQGIPTMVGVN